MNAISETEHGLTISGPPAEILTLTQHLREAFDRAGSDMPQTLHDLVFKLEVALQNCGVLDENFNVTNKES